MKKLIALLWLVIASNAAFAQSFPKPPDVPAYVPVAATYAAGTTPNVLGDGSDAKGGTPPAFAYQLPDIPTPSRSNWLLTGTNSTPGTPATNIFCKVPDETFGTPPHGCTEPKARFHANYSHTLPDDPIRAWCQPGNSHYHEFFGNQFANACSTYASLRTKRSSTASGGQLNATAYWAPVVTKQIGGTLWGIKPNFHVIYYNSIDAFQRLTMQRLPRGLRYVCCFNMDDPDDTLIKKEVAVANAQPGTSPTRYSVPAAGYGHGIVGWQCVPTSGSNAANGQFQPYLKTAGGTDAFQAAYGATCLSGTLLMTVSAPECWDGRNLWSPGGYIHMRYRIKDNLAPGDGLVCPNGWYRLPQLQLIFIYPQNGSSDYTTWRLSSDDHAEAKLNSLPTCTGGYANAPCNEGGGTRIIRNGESFHTDWLGGWDDATMVTWMSKCLGLLGEPNGAQCEPATISATQGLKYVLPDGRTVNTTTVHSTTDTADMVKLGTVHRGPATIHHH